MITDLDLSFFMHYSSGVPFDSSELIFSSILTVLGESLICLSSLTANKSFLTSSFFFDPLSRDGGGGSYLARSSGNVIFMKDCPDGSYWKQKSSTLNMDSYIDPFEVILA